MREDIFAELRSDIIKGALKPGTQLKEIQLAERFGVSRTPIRDALSRLEDSGLATRVNRVLEVKGINPETIMQVYDMRVLLEVQAAGEAALNHSLSDVLTLEALLERDKSLTKPSDRQLIDANLEFHRAVWKATNNPILIDLLERLMTHMVHAPTTTLSVSGRQKAALTQHEDLITAISNRDQEAARNVARIHFSEARAIRLDLLRKAAVEDAIRN